MESHPERVHALAPAMPLLILDQQQLASEGITGGGDTIWRLLLREDLRFKYREEDLWGSNSNVGPRH